MIIFLICLCALGALTLVVQTFVFGRITKQDKARNKFLADELMYLQKRRQTEKRLLEDTENDRREWEKRYTACFQHLREDRHKISTAWHAHQVVKKGKQVICLTAIVEASDGPGAVAAFEAQMKEVKAKMRIRSKAPVFAKPVFPNI